ncbi:conserved hypothetical protein [Talaromyces stipitatus ATCC 10500]|uniref:Nephrocystin 3-like N-terminal domain-containing protein n=1 Tax=Talaromyces stipitatus (strain ATCC 10500 / CBS 375.48 / QM 6759 / NRRL 1006) TaxID=441959 RepID=B8M8S9_TALSN|nr:uncharacterized protein TSTA_038050 [Talaromyces stipitatus ATCC 10500]EED20592.1 conserved hypothetical protein [Talaromyces stipitatus ATCC 10500]
MLSCFSRSMIERGGWVYLPLGDLPRPDRRQNYPEGKNGINLSFFIHGRGSFLQKALLGFYRTVLFQLLDHLSSHEKKPEALSKLEESFKRQCDSRGPLGKSWHWETAQLAKEFQLALREVEKNGPVYLYVDALDECGEEEAKRFAATIEKIIEAFADGKLHICFSCRHYPPLMLEDLSDMHIGGYVHSQLNPFAMPEIADKIISLSVGNFMWTHLVVETLPGLGELYGDLLQAMLGDENSLRLVQWICFADRPLSLEELRWAMFVEAHPEAKSLGECRVAPDFPCDCANQCDCDVIERRVKGLSRGLIEVTHAAITDSGSNRTAQFIHGSVQEFFLDKGAFLRLHHSISSSRSLDHVKSKARNSITQTCIRYCRMKEIRQAIAKFETNSAAGLALAAGPLQRGFPFLHYAVMTWAQHENESSPAAYFHWRKDSELLDSLLRVFPDVSEQHAVKRKRSQWSFDKVHLATKP